MGLRKCEICTFKERQGGEKLWFAKFPLREHICKQWVKVVGKEDLVHVPIEKLHDLRYVCEKHFHKRDFTKSKSRLKKHAIPTLSLQLPALPDKLLAIFPVHMAGSIEEVYTLDHDYDKNKELIDHTYSKTEHGQSSLPETANKAPLHGADCDNTEQDTQIQSSLENDKSTATIDHIPLIDDIKTEDLTVDPEDGLMTLNADIAESDNVAACVELTDGTVDNVTKLTAVTVKNTAVTVKNTAVTIKNTAVTVKNSAVTVKDPAVTVKDPAVTVKDPAVTVKNKAQQSKDRSRQLDDDLACNKCGYPINRTVPYLEMESKLNKCQKQLKLLKNAHALLKLNKKKLKKPIMKASFERVTKKMTPIAKQITKLQMKSGITPRGRRYSYDDRILCLAIYYIAPTHYNLLAKMLTLISLKQLMKDFPNLRVIAGATNVQKVDNPNQDNNNINEIVNIESIEPQQTDVNNDNPFDINHPFLKLSKSIKKRNISSKAKPKPKRSVKQKLAGARRRVLVRVNNKFKNVTLDTNNSPMKVIIENIPMFEDETLKATRNIMIQKKTHQCSNVGNNSTPLYHVDENGFVNEIIPNTDETPVVFSTISSDKEINRLNPIKSTETVKRKRKCDKVFQKKFNKTQKLDIDKSRSLENYDNKIKPGINRLQPINRERNTSHNNTAKYKSLKPVVDETRQATDSLIQYNTDLESYHPIAVPLTYGYQIERSGVVYQYEDADEQERSFGSQLEIVTHQYDIGVAERERPAETDNRTEV